MIAKIVTVSINALLKAMIRRPPAAEFGDARRFLFLQYEKPLGAAVLATTVFEALKRQIPDAYVSVAASGFSYEALRNNPYVDEIFETPQPLKSFGSALRFFLSVVRRRRREFDCVVCNAGGARLKITLLAFVSGIRLRIGYEGSIHLLHRSLPLHPGESVIANYLRIMEVIGCHAETAEPKLYLREQDLRSIKSWFVEQHICRKRPIIGMVTQTNGGEPNAWFSDRFGKLSRSLIALHDAQLIFVGVADDSDEVEKIRTLAAAKTFSAVGKTNISQLAALFAQCDLVVTLDTGGFHVARAVQTPCVVIGNAARPATEWLPQNNPLFLVLRREDVPCSLCGKFFCATRECMQAISVEDVLSAVARQLPGKFTARHRL